MKRQETNLPRIALQTFTIRKSLKSPIAIERALKRVRSIGYKCLELAYIRFEEKEIAAVKRVCDNADIQISSTQITYDFLNRRRDWVLNFHERLDCQQACISVLPTKAIKNGRNGILAFAEQAETLGAYYRQRGLNLCFHNHDFELQRFDGDLALDLFANATSEENVGLVLDTYWMTRGGLNASRIIRKYGSRVKGVHLRDYGLRWRFFELVPDDVELGAGNLDVGEIVETCKDIGVPYMAVEQSCGDPYAKITKSAEHLRSLGFNFQTQDYEK